MLFNGRSDRGNFVEKWIFESRDFSNDRIVRKKRVSQILRDFLNLWSECSDGMRKKARVRLSGKYLSFADVFFTTVHLRRNAKSSLWNIAVFIPTEQNGSYVIRGNNIKQGTLCVYYLLIKQKKLFGQPNISHVKISFLGTNQKERQLGVSNRYNTAIIPRLYRDPN